MQEFFQALGTRLQETFDPAAAGTAVARLTTNVFVGALVLIAFLVIWKLAYAVLRRVLERTKVDPTASAFIVTALKYTTIIFGLLSALAAMGIDTNKMFASLGIAGLTLGFAARDALSNVISGVLIFWDRPFVIGDLIEIDGQYGRVEAITLRSTRVVTVDGRMLAVPNTNVISSTVASYTNFPHLRLDVPVTIGVGEDFERARRILLELVGDPDVYMADPAPRVAVTALGDYHNEVELQVWIQDERSHVERRFRLREAAYRALRDAGIDMPFETLSIEPVQVVGGAASA